MKDRSADRLLKGMKKGVVYRRAELQHLSKAVDRDLKGLVVRGDVKKPAPGLFYRPRLSRWGLLPAEMSDLIRAYLKTDDFLLTTPTNFNVLGVGLTQVYNITTVYNTKRHGRVKLEGQNYNFKRAFNYPRRLNEEFLFIDLLNSLDEVVEKPDDFDLRVERKLKTFDRKRILKAAARYGKASTRKFVEQGLDA